MDTEEEKKHAIELIEAYKNSVLDLLDQGFQLESYSCTQNKDNLITFTFTLNKNV